MLNKTEINKIKNTQGQDKPIAPTNIIQRKWKTIIVLILVTLISVYALLNNSNASYSISRDSVQIATVERGTLERDINAVGKIVAANAPIIYGSALGTITLLVKPGDKIIKNQSVAQINSPELLNKLQLEQASLQSLQFESERQKLNIRRSQLTQKQQLDMALVALNAAKREFHRSQIAIKKNLISQLDYEKSQDDLTRAKLEYKHQQNQAELNQDSLNFDAKTQQAKVKRQQWLVTELQRQVDNLQLHAPIAGIVGNWLTTQKSRVSLSQPLMTIVDLSAFEAELLVAESYADEIGLGMSVELQIAGEQLLGKISSISPEVTDRQVRTRVRFDKNSTMSFRQNQRLNARIILASKANILKIQNGDFVQTGAGKIAYLVQNNVAKKISITLGVNSLSQIEVLSGVEAGNKLIISSLDAFNNAEQVLLR